MSTSYSGILIVCASIEKAFRRCTNCRCVGVHTSACVNIALLIARYQLLMTQRRTAIKQHASEHGISEADVTFSLQTTFKDLLFSTLVFVKRQPLIAQSSWFLKRLVLLTEPRKLCKIHAYIHRYLLKWTARTNRQRITESTADHCAQLIIINIRRKIHWLDMSINVKKSSCRRYNSLCTNLTTLDGRDIMWINKVQYLGVHLVSSKALSCNYDLIKRLFIVHLMRSMERPEYYRLMLWLNYSKLNACLLLYGLDACPASPRQLRSLNNYCCVVRVVEKFIM